MSELLRWAEQYLQEGFSIIPVALIKLPDGKSRKPALVDWKKYQLSPPTLEEVKSWFSNPEQFEAIRNGNKIGIAIVTGKVSGNLAVIDFDSKEVAGEFLGELAEKNPELYEKFINTWVVETGKGFHYYFRVKEPDLKLFTSRIGIREGIDIKAEGGSVVAPPSEHPWGNGYRFLNKPDRIAELSWEEYLSLLRILERNEGLETEQDLTSRELIEFSKPKEERELSESEILEFSKKIWNYLKESLFAINKDKDHYKIYLVASKIMVIDVFRYNAITMWSLMNLGLSSLSKWHSKPLNKLQLTSLFSD